jgi:LacI family gluconate utilization system Gnt-I transcriptional repressor
MKHKRVRPGGQAIRMMDVARHAGVSSMTVSRALRDPDKVSEESRRRVHAAISEIGYLPNRLAGSLASNRSNVVGLILPSIQNSLFANTIQGISDVLRSSGFHLMIGDSGYSLAEEEALISMLLAQRVSGLVLHNTRHTPRARWLIREGRIPTVETGNLAHQPLDMSVSYSNYAAAKAMTLHLVWRGYRTIGLVSLFTKENDRARQRRRGHFAALEESGLTPDPALALEVAPGLATGAQALVQLVENHPKLDAVFFAGDVLAMGAILECQRRGWAVPSRIAVASFDDLDLLQHIVPAVTTIRIPRYEIGRRSAEVLLDRINGKANERLCVDLGFEIIQRQST